MLQRRPPKINENRVSTIKKQDFQTKNRIFPVIYLKRPIHAFNPLNVDINTTVFTATSSYTWSLSSKPLPSPCPFPVHPHQSAVCTLNTNTCLFYILSTSSPLPYSTSPSKAYHFLACSNRSESSSKSSILLCGWSYVFWIIQSVRSSLDMFYLITVWLFCTMLKTLSESSFEWGILLIAIIAGAKVGYLRLPELSFFL